jgi:ribosomal protection tetracycline resistance protein
MRTLNLGILAHVDAGKTTLTERLLYAAGAIPQFGSVDAGTTQTDYLALERERGITIRTAVASLAMGDLAVNIIDTPGHPDFIAEVERALSVLDAAVLVVSAVEGVQSQTPLLMRALQRLHLPILVFVNKIDRVGADGERTLDAVLRRLTPAALALGHVQAAGTRSADFLPADTADEDFRARLTDTLTEHDEDLLRAFVSASTLSYSSLRRALTEQTARALVVPVFFGSAATGAGIGALMTGIGDLLPRAAGDQAAPLSARIFKIERGSSREKVAYVRLFTGVLAARERVRLGPGREGKVTALAVSAPGGSVARDVLVAGEVGQLRGLAGAMVGDWLGVARAGAEHHFAPPTLESVVRPSAAADRGRLLAALGELAEQDPLINVRQDDARGETWVSLYGEVQKEVIRATLERDYGVASYFTDTTTICTERLAGSGSAGEVLRAKTHTNVTGNSSPTSDNPFPATLGLTIEPAPPDAGIEVHLNVDYRLVPLYIYKTAEAFLEQLTGYVRDALREGLAGWQVNDATVTVVDCGYRAPGTTAGDFRKLVPLVLMRALEQAGTTVCEPMVALDIEAPAASVSALLVMLGRLGARAQPPALHDRSCRVEASLPVARLPDLRRLMPGATAGEGVVETHFAGYQPVTGPPPTRRRTTPNPLHVDEYLAHLAGLPARGD